MNLSQRCIKEFNLKAIKVGQKLFDDGAVFLDDLSPTDLSVTVETPRAIHDVELEFEGDRSFGKIGAGCSCKDFACGELCGHIFAALLLGDAHAWLAKQVVNLLKLRLERDRSLEIYLKHEVDTSIVPANASRRNAPQMALGLNPALTPPATNWKSFLDSLQKSAPKPPTQLGIERAPPERELWYAFNAYASLSAGSMVIDLYCRDRRSSGDWGVMKELRVSRADAAAFVMPEHGRILSQLFGCVAADPENLPYQRYQIDPRQLKYSRFVVDPSLQLDLLKSIAATGHLTVLDLGQDRPEPIPRPFAAEAEPWQLRLHIGRCREKAGHWVITPELRRGQEVKSVTEPRYLIPQGLVLFSGEFAPLQPISPTELQWVIQARTAGKIRVRANEFDRFVKSLYRVTALPPIDWEDGVPWQLVTGIAVPLLSVERQRGDGDGLLRASLAFDYGAQRLSPEDTLRSWTDPDQKHIVARNYDEEAARRNELATAGDDLRRLAGHHAVYVLPPTSLGPLTRRLTANGWRVEAMGRPLRPAGEFKAILSSGTDWFDLKASVTFGSQHVSLPQLLAAKARGDAFIQLSDGSVGMLPEEWLAKYAGLNEFGQELGDKVRFQRAQMPLLDALLADLPAVDVDGIYAALRRKLQSGVELKPAVVGPEFRGHLRPYQADGLAWLEYLREFGFGGCLADDMGLGKTVQVLAMLQRVYGDARNVAATPRPTLLIVPRSLVDNWLNEAARFTPGLRCLDYSATGRVKLGRDLRDYDVIITTYGVARRDIKDFAARRFHYVILDEAQAIKNQQSQVAKCVRLLRSDHRLAMSGTPVENHLGELGSLFAFLSPGLLGHRLQATLAARALPPGSESVKILARVLRPFILRRTKEQVLRDLPQKTEQTLYCELGQIQRRHYDDLRQFYTRSLAKTVKDKGLNRSKIQILEALLRLRQAACHLGLIDHHRRHEASAKLELLLGKLEEVLESGHKALVFSQFTSMLALVQEALKARQIAYEYLDGGTRNRQAVVDRFQAPTGAGVFLISLKAGGVGLNLTAADYCFILDPWWNPAVEAQAIGRAHRLGQNRQVFAYRLIAKDTVEEKILQLQAGKRQLAEAIVSEENSVLGGMSLEDLELLLS